MDKETKDASLEFVTNWIDSQTRKHKVLDDFICKAQNNPTELNKAVELIVILMSTGIIKIPIKI